MIQCSLDSKQVISPAYLRLKRAVRDSFRELIDKMCLIFLARPMPNEPW